MPDDNPRFEITRRNAIRGIATTGALSTVAGIGTATPGRTKETTRFTVRIENVASLDEYPSAPDPPLSTSGAVWITPGAYGIYKGRNPILSRNKAASSGLEAIAEAGRPGGTPENDSLVSALDGMSNVARAGSWTPDDTVADPNDPLDAVPGAPPIAPEGAFEFDIEAAPGEKLAFATMFVPSNDVFFAPGPGGIALFDDDAPIDESVTDDVILWDAGTEPNEDPGSDSPNQAPRQGLEFGNPDKGPDEHGVVRELRPTDKVDDGYRYPDPSEAIDVTITPQ